MCGLFVRLDCRLQVKRYASLRRKHSSCRHTGVHRYSLEKKKKSCVNMLDVCASSETVRHSIAHVRSDIGQLTDLQSQHDCALLRWRTREKNPYAAAIKSDHTFKSNAHTRNSQRVSIGLVVLCTGGYCIVSVWRFAYARTPAQAYNNIYS